MWLPTLKLSRAKTHSSWSGSLNELTRLLPEPMFLQALCLERKRAERSRKLFVLMLLETGNSVQNGDGNNAVNQMVSAVFSSIRETDIAGWYKGTASVLGVIFAELGAADKNSILGVLRTKVPTALQPS